ncbi:beta-mannosidase [Mucilaginibacter sp. 21P]|uniref:glycoside hydrolase family 2 protein n=1 Tax=Mucilaginibacter sp. 21P TaxID=2778902 RepID=UPI001C5859C3|nr:sugar-binding domain-containing protein [Mucilaginibacter sp. 21P]QXV65257.1 beta-mannosidase [Mucilaginibacter sp. 21P]
MFKSLYVFILFSICAINAFAQNSSALKWKLFPQDEHNYTGQQVSSIGFSAPNWIDGVVPGTVFYAYVKAGKEANPDFADNIYKVDKAKYNRPYWYRAEFSVKPEGNRTWLNFNGVHKRAEVYFNGKHIGTIQGIVQRGRYDVTDLLNSGKANAVAVLIIPPDASFGLANRQAPTYLSSGSWDWMPAVPGLNSGITDTVALTTTGPVIIEDAQVKTKLINNKLADLNVNAWIKNSTDKPVSGKLNVTIQPGNIVLNSAMVTIAPNASQTVNFDENAYDQLRIKNPLLWWPNGYGKQDLYTCKVSFSQDNKSLSDIHTQRFGIRKVSADTTSVNGRLRVYVNNVPILLKGGNWGMSDYMLKVRGKDYEPRIRMHKEMNFNIIRNWTGEVTDEAFYQYCDKYGIMVWDDFWLNNFGPIDSINNFKVNAIEKVKKYRQHPSIIIWCGANEGLPGGDTTGALSMAIKNAIRDNDEGQRLYIARSNAGTTNPNFSIHGGSRNLSGSGNWSNSDPKVYFTDPHNGYLFSKGSWGMRSELGTATFVNIESFKKFMPKDYWVPPTPQTVDSKDNMWAKHYFSTNGDLGGGAAPAKYVADVNRSYGQATSIEEFCKKSQMLNLETMKAMFEGWNDHMWNDATGMLIWMSQSAYPSMIWQTYDYYYDLTGAYFGAKVACEPVHIQWNAATNSVKVINNRAYAINKLTANAEVYGLDGKLIPGYSTTKMVNVPMSSATEAFSAFTGKDTTALPEIYFMKLKLTDNAGKLVSENFYWIGKKHLDYRAFDKMAKVGSLLDISKGLVSGAENKDNKLITYVVTNKSKNSAAYGVRAQLLNTKGQQILPALISNSYFSLMQGESRKIQIEVDAKQLANGYKLDVKAYNN